MNKLTVEVYSSGTTRIPDQRNELVRAENIRFSTGYPGGVYLDASFYVARDVVEWWAVSGAKRAVLRNGQTVVYEGEIDDLSNTLRQTGQGIVVGLTGYWGALLMRRRWGKNWSDDRISANVWVWKEDIATYTGAELCTLDRNNRLRFTPKAETWADGEFAAVRYQMPSGTEYVKKITYDYDFAEAAGAHDWELGWWDAINGFVSIAAATGGAAAQTYTPAGAPEEYLELRFYSRDAQAAVWDGTYYGEVSNVVMYGNEDAAHSVDLTQICKDVISHLNADSVMNSTDHEIDTITLVDEIIPFINEDFPTIANILIRAAKVGDDSQNGWAVGVYESEKAPAADGTPVLFCEQYLPLTDYDYAIRLDEPNVVGSVSLIENFDNVWNWVVITYTDDLGVRTSITPDDNANLTDATSVTDYGQRDHVLNEGYSNSTTSVKNGRRFLKEHKDPEWLLIKPLKIKGYIRDDQNQRVPVSQVQAGKRIKIENFLHDTIIADAGLTFRISNTTYNDKDKTISIRSGEPGEFLISPSFIIDQRLRGK